MHIAMAPTKNMDRTEWFTEKATEIGFDELSFLNCRYSERKVIKKERIEKILVSAVKQSLKATMPVLNEMTDFNKFVSRDLKGRSSSPIAMKGKTFVERYIAFRRRCFGDDRSGRRF